MAAPLESVTVPVREAVSWAHAAAHKITINNQIRTSVRFDFMVKSSPQAHTNYARSTAFRLTRFPSVGSNGPASANRLKVRDGY